MDVIVLVEYDKEVVDLFDEKLCKVVGLFNFDDFVEFVDIL